MPARWPIPDNQLSILKFNIFSMTSRLLQFSRAQRQSSRHLKRGGKAPTSPQPGQRNTVKCGTPPTTAHRESRPRHAWTRSSGTGRRPTELTHTTGKDSLRIRYTPLNRLQLSETNLIYFGATEPEKLAMWTIDLTRRSAARSNFPRQLSLFSPARSSSRPALTLVRELFLTKRVKNYYHYPHSS